jgi:hypothetical protein
MSAPSAVAIWSTKGITLETGLLDIMCLVLLQSMSFDRIGVGGLVVCF